jgi:hypothetical protein
MFKKSMTALALVFGLTGVAYAADQLPVETLDVDETVQKMPWEDSDAAIKHPTLPAELSAAIKMELDNRVADNGFIVDVDIWEISMVGQTDLPEDGRFDRLGGFVYISRSEGTEPDYTFPILMHAIDAGAVPTEALETAMVAAFADETVNRLDGMNVQEPVTGAMN